MITVVLVGPEGEENIGSAARAMLNMDVNQMYLVAPNCSHLSKNSLKYAVHAQNVLKEAKIFPTLSDAIKGADLSVAISRRVGQWRKQDFVLEDLAKFLQDYRNKDVRLIFGREKTGLTNEEINECDTVCSIPSSEKFPSLNLAQAVMVTLYDIYRTGLGTQTDEQFPPASREDFDGMLSQIISTLDFLGFFKSVPEWRLTNYIKKILIRAKLDSYDTNVIQGIFKRITGIVSKTAKERKLPIRKK